MKYRMMQRGKEPRPALSRCYYRASFLNMMKERAEARLDGERVIGHLLPEEQRTKNLRICLLTELRGFVTVNQVAQTAIPKREIISAYVVAMEEGEDIQSVRELHQRLQQSGVTDLPFEKCETRLKGALYAISKKSQIFFQDVGCLIPIFRSNGKLTFAD